MPDSSFEMRGTEVPLDVRGADGHDHILSFKTRGGGVQMGAIMSRHSKQEEEG